MGKEVVIESKVTERFEERGWLERKCIYAGRKGSPDRWYLRKGMWVLVEYKRPGEQPDAIQKREHQRLADHGQKVIVIDNIELGYDLVERLTAESDERARRK